MRRIRIGSTSSSNAEKTAGPAAGVESCKGNTAQFPPYGFKPVSYTHLDVYKRQALTYEKAQQHPEINIIINTTPAGMYPNNGSCLLDLHAFPKLEAVLDLSLIHI